MFKIEYLWEVGQDMSFLDQTVITFTLYANGFRAWLCIMMFMDGKTNSF